MSAQALPLAARVDSLVRDGRLGGRHERRAADRKPIHNAFARREASCYAWASGTTDPHIVTVMLCLLGDGCGRHDSTYCVEVDAGAAAVSPVASPVGPIARRPSPLGVGAASAGDSSCLDDGCWYACFPPRAVADAFPV